MERLKVSCSGCGYQTELLVGTPELSQTYSDLNEDFAFYEVFECPTHRGLLSIDVHDRTFRGACPADGAALRKVEDDRPGTCPRCGQPLSISRLETEEALSK